MNEFRPTPYQLAACLVEINGKGCDCGSCAKSRCCVAWEKDATKEVLGGNIPKAISYLIGAGGCYPGSYRKGYTFIPTGEGCTVEFSTDCTCPLPCADKDFIVVGLGNEKLPAKKCGSWKCALNATGDQCFGCGAPCFCGGRSDED